MRQRLTLTPRQYYYVACAALATLVLIVFTGAAVRVTGSGLGCPDWPNCYENGRLTPELGTHSYIEFGNRMLTSIVGISAIAAALLAFTRRPFRRDLAALALLLPFGVLGQAVMGGLTVLYGLAPGWVMAHFGLSMLIIVAAGALAWRARPSYREGERAGDPLVARAVWALFAIGAVTLFVGTAATAAGPHAGGSGTGDVVERLQFKGSDTVSWLVNRHGVIAALLGAAAVGTWLLARRRGADAALVHRLERVCLLMALQGVLGIVQFRLDVPAELVWVHVALATLLWVGIVLAAVQAGSPFAEEGITRHVLGPPQDHRDEMLRFLVVGGFGYVLAMLFYAALIAAGVSPYVAVPPVFVFNGLFNFTLNRLWSFPRSGRPVHHELGRFVVVAAGSLAANYTVLYLLHDVAGLAPVPAQALAIVAATPVGFLGNKFFSFAQLPPAARGPSESAP